VENPGFIVQALGQLQECLEILSAKFQLRFWSAKTKALPGRQLSLRIWPDMTQAFAGAAWRLEVNLIGSTLGNQTGTDTRVERIV